MCESRSSCSFRRGIAGRGYADGHPGENACQLAGRILSLPGCEGLKGLNRISMERLMDVRGIGQVKAVQLKCVAELAARVGKSESG